MLPKKPFLLVAQKGNIISKPPFCTKILLHRLQNVIREFIYIYWFFHFLIYLLYQNVQFRFRNIIFDFFHFDCYYKRKKKLFANGFFFPLWDFPISLLDAHLGTGYVPQSLTPQTPTTTQVSLVKRTLLSRFANISWYLGVRLFCVVDVN